MKIQYHKPDTYAKRKRANFMLSSGSFFSSIAIAYAVTVIGTAIAIFIIIVISAVK